MLRTTPFFNSKISTTNRSANSFEKDNFRSGEAGQSFGTIEYLKTVVDYLKTVVKYFKTLIEYLKTLVEYHDALCSSLHLSLIDNVYQRLVIGAL